MIQEVTLLVGRIAAGIFGAVAGALLTAFTVWFLCRYTVRRQPPRPVNRMLRVLGAVAGAIAAIMFLPIGYGGFGLGSGGLGLGPGGGGFKPTETPAASLSQIDPKSRQPAERAVIVMLGGSLVRGEAYYRFDDDATPRTLTEVQQRLRARIQADPPLTAIDVVIYFEDSLARQSAPVVRLVEWAQQSGLTVNVAAKPGHIPP